MLLENIAFNLLFKIIKLLNIIILFKIIKKYIIIIRIFISGNYTKFFISYFQTQLIAIVIKISHFQTQLNAIVIKILFNIYIIITLKIYMTMKGSYFETHLNSF